MKTSKLLILTIIALFMNASATKSQNFTLDCNLKNTSDKKLTLITIKDGKQVELDAKKVDNTGKFKFTGKVEHPTLCYISHKKTNIPVFVENKKIKITGDFAAPEEIIITGSKTQDVLNKYNKETAQYTTKLSEIYTEYENLMLSFKENPPAKNPDETKEAYKLRTENELQMKTNILEQKYDSILTIEQAYTKNFIKTHNKSFVSPYLILAVFGDEDISTLKELCDIMDKSLDQSPHLQYMQNKIKSLLGSAVGQPFIDFTQNDVNGKPVSLSKFKGSVILIDFWASWCRPCRAANPHVVELYKKYHDKGLNIIGVSFDENKANWEKAIKDDNLTWTQVSDLKGWQNAAGQLYGVTSIPHTVLIDKKGIIVAKKLRPAELDEQIEKLLKQ